jgi:hypothetical protein
VSGFIDGVSKIWIMDRDHGALRIGGFRSRIEAIDSLIRREMVRDDGEANKAAIRLAVEEALRHMDPRLHDAGDCEIDDCALHPW